MGGSNKLKVWIRRGKGWGGGRGRRDISDCSSFPTDRGQGELQFVFVGADCAFCLDLTESRLFSRRR